MPDRGVRFADQVVPHIELLVRVARSMVAQPADAEDLVQETMLAAWRSLGTFDGSSPRAWLLTIMRHQHINLGRRDRPRPVADEDLLTQSGPGRGVTFTAEDILAGDIADSVLSEILDGLPRALMEVLVLMDVEGLSRAETAQVLGMKESTVRTRLARARSLVRQSFATHRRPPSAPAVRRPGAEHWR